MCLHATIEHLWFSTAERDVLTWRQMAKVRHLCVALAPDITRMTLEHAAMWCFDAMLVCKENVKMPKILWMWFSNFKIVYRFSWKWTWSFVVSSSNVASNTTQMPLNELTGRVYHLLHWYRVFRSDTHVIPSLNAFVFITLLRSSSTCANMTLSYGIYR